MMKIKLLILAATLCLGSVVAAQTTGQITIGTPSVGSTLSIGTAETPKRERKFEMLTPEEKDSLKSARDNLAKALREMTAAENKVKQNHGETYYQWCYSPSTMTTVDLWEDQIALIRTDTCGSNLVLTN